MPLTALKPSPDFVKTAEASRAWARRVTDPAGVEDAIREALAVTREGRLALLDIATLPD
jgi:acetolactate synthase-1/2/3 large subunit